MKKILATAFGLALAASAAIALQEPPMNPPANEAQAVSQETVGTTYIGTVTTLDTQQRSLTIKDANGKVTTYYWTETVKVPAEMKVGDAVTIIATDENGRMTATTITVTSKTTTKKTTKY